MKNVIHTLAARVLGGASLFLLGIALVGEQRAEAGNQPPTPCEGPSGDATCEHNPQLPTTCHLVGGDSCDPGNYCSCAGEWVTVPSENPPGGIGYTFRCKCG